MAIKRGGRPWNLQREGWPWRDGTGFGVGSVDGRSRLVADWLRRHHAGGELRNQGRAKASQFHRQRGSDAPEQLSCPPNNQVISSHVQPTVSPNPLHHAASRRAF